MTAPAATLAADPPALTVGRIDPTRLYTQAEAMVALRVSERTVRRHMAAGRLTKRAASNRVMFLGADLLRLVGIDDEPPRLETESERKRRADRAAAEFRANKAKRRAKAKAG